MRLREVFRSLALHSLHDPLGDWFSKSYMTLNGRIMSFHYTKELTLEAWEDSRLGYLWSKAFALYLQGQDRNADPVFVAKNFFVTDSNFKLLGCNSGILGTPINVVRLEHVIARLGEAPFKIILDDKIKCSMIREMLEERETPVGIGHDGYAWFTIYEEGFENIENARAACDLLGKPYRKNHFYLILSIQGRNTIVFRRSTLHDARGNEFFRPYCDTRKWGRTLTKERLEDGVPESMSEETEALVKHEKDLLPSPDSIPYPAPNIWESYFTTEIEDFKHCYPEVHVDLNNAWTNKPQWWR